MTLQASDHALLLTNPAATSGSSIAQPDPAASLGGYASTTQVASGVIGALFDTVTASQALAGQTDYRCVAYRNLSPTHSALALALWLIDPAGGGEHAIGLDPVGIVPATGTAAQGTSIATKTTAPAGVAFSTPTPGAPLIVGDVGVGMCILVWVRRIVAPGTPGAAADPLTITARAETV